MRLVDSAQFQRMLDTYDYDMVPVAWYNSLSPGNEQKFYYGSDGRTVEGTRNYPGIADPAVDRMIDALLTADCARGFRRRGARPRPAAGQWLLHRAVLRFRRPMGGALEPHRPSRGAAACRVSKAPHCGMRTE